MKFLVVAGDRGLDRVPELSYLCPNRSVPDSIYERIQDTAAGTTSEVKVGDDIKGCIFIQS